MWSQVCLYRKRLKNWQLVVEYTCMWIVSNKHIFFPTASYTINGIRQPPIEKSLGSLPIMLKSKACHLKNLSPAQLIEKGEQETEWGGFFITGGHERLIRMLQTTRRNYPVSMQRPSWKNRGKNFSDLGISIGKLFFGLFTAKVYLTLLFMSIVIKKIFWKNHASNKIYILFISLKMLIPTPQLLSWDKLINGNWAMFVSKEQYYFLTFPVCF